MSAADGWAPLGPSCIYNGMVGRNRAPTSGRVTAIVVDTTDAKTVYAGTATGGVWKTSDGGQTWQPMMDDQLSMSVGALALDRKNNTRLYVGTGESNDAGEALQGAGIFIYDGIAWTLKGYDKLNGQRVSRIIIDSSGAKNRLLVGSDAGLFESLDDGDSFTQILPTPKRVDDLAYNPASAVLYVAVNGDTVYTRTGAAAPLPVPKGGQNGVCGLAGIGRIAVALCDSQPLNIYAAFAKDPSTGDTGFHGIWFSKDGGTNWEKKNLPTGTLVNGYYNLVLAVDPNDPNTLYFGEKDLWKSIDGANSWTSVSAASGKSPGIHADQHAVAFSKPDPADPTKKKDVWVGNDGGVWVSKDQGNTFFHRNRGLATLQYYAIAQHPHEATVLLAGAQDNGTQRYEGSPTWDLTYGGDGFYCAIDPKEPKRCYASYCYINPANNSIAAIQRSEKYGAPESWSYIVAGITNTFPGAYPFYTPFVIDPKPDPKDHHPVLYLGTNRLYRTSDFGDWWDCAFDLNATPAKTFETGTTPNTTITAIAVDPSDNTNIYVGTHDGRLFLCHFEGGINYRVSDLTGAGVDGELISDIAVPPPGWAGMPGTPLVSPVIVALGSPQLAATKVTPRPKGRIFVNHGILDARQWKELRDPGDHNLDLTISGQAFPYIGNPVNAIAIDPNTTPFTVYIGCNIGVFKRSGIADGQNWQPFRENLPNVPVTDLQFHAEKKLLRAATMGRSVWERSLGTIPTKTVDLYIRDNIVDTGRPPTPDTATDPTSGDQVTPFSGADIKVDTPFLSIGKFQTPASTIDFTDTGAADYIAFAQFTTGHLFQGTTSKIYVQVENRGPDPANNVYVRAFIGPMSSADTKTLPGNFWTSFPTADPDPSPWKPIGEKSKCPTLRPGEPWVAEWDFKLPSWSGDAGIFVCATCDEDKLTDYITNLDPSFIPKQVAANNKMVALRQVSTRLSAGETAAAVFIALGIAALIGAGVGLGYHFTKKK